MKTFFLALALSVIGLLHAQTNAGRPMLDVFATALTKAKARTKVPILLPSELPTAFADAKNAVVEKVGPEEYVIGLYYELDIGNAGFAASFSGMNNSPYSPKELPNVHQVKLSGGAIGFFRPVSCGGSCAPANLWWQKGALYQIQLKLPSDLSAEEQERIITAVANSAIMAGS
jgi:hypothetical protein